MSYDKISPYIDNTIRAQGLEKLLGVSAPLPEFDGWAIDRTAAEVLVSLILRQRPKCIVELGSGLSTVLMAYALKKLGQGTLLTLEHDASYKEKTSNLLSQHQLSSYVQLFHAPLEPYVIDGGEWKWYELPGAIDNAAIDLVFVDGPPGALQKNSRYPAIPLLKKHFSIHTCIVLDDALRNDEKEILAAWTKPSKMRDTECTILPTSKGLAILRYGSIG